MRLVRLAQAARGYRNGVKGTRATAWLAGRIWTGRHAVRGVARNGARMRTSANGVRFWRGPSKSGKGWKSNLEHHVRGDHRWGDFHVNHRSPKRWAPWW